jgi:hypothetical protein
MSNLSTTNSNNLIALASIIGISITKDMSIEEINTVGSFFTLLGDLISLIATQKENLS